MKFSHEMPNKNIYLHVVTPNALTDGLCKEGKLEEDMKVNYYHWNNYFIASQMH